MRLLIATLPAYGHTYPLVPLAAAARRAGHDVLFATGQEFHPTLRRFDLEVTAAGIPMREALDDPRVAAVVPEPGAPLDPRPRLIFGDLQPRRVAADLAPTIESWAPDLMVEEIMNFGASIAAVRAGVPRVRHTFGRVSGWLAESLDPVVAATVEDLGLPPGLVGIDTPGPVIDICPPTLADPFLPTLDRVPLRPQALRVPGEDLAPAFEQRRPAVYVTMGTAFGNVEVLRTILAGVRSLEAQVLVAVGSQADPRSLGTVGDRVRVERWVPQADVLDRVDLVIHHGGSGTMLGAAAAGVPQLLLPQGADQFSNAAAATAGDVAQSLAPTDQTPEKIASAARHLLSDPGSRRAATALADEIAAMPAPSAVVPWLTRQTHLAG